MIVGDSSGGVFQENLFGLCLLYSVSYIKSIPTHEKVFAGGKSGPNATCSLTFHGLSWPWVGELDGFIIIFLCFPTSNPTEFGKIANTLVIV